MKYISGTILSVRFKVQITEFGQYGISVIAFNSSEPVVDTLAFLHTIKPFCHYFRILP